MARSAPESQQAAAVSDGRGGAGGVEWGAPGTTQGSGGFWVGAVFLPGESRALCPRKLLPAIAPSVAIANPPHSTQKEAEVVYTVGFTAHPPTFAACVSQNIPWPSPQPPRECSLPS